MRRAFQVAAKKNPAKAGFFQIKAI